MKPSLIYQYLDQLAIEYLRQKHAPVYTSEQARRLVPPLPGATVKNLFLRDKKGRRYILLVMEDMKKIDLKVLAGNLGLSNLSLASAERLMEYLGVEPGAVSLLALVNDSTKQVEVFIDQDIWKAEALQSHPLVNTETLVIKIEDMERFLEATGHQFKLIEIQ